MTMPTISPTQWQDLRFRFLQRYPAFIDFNQPGKGFAEAELNYKEEILQRFEQRGVRQKVTQLVDEGRGLEALKELQRINFKNLIAYQSWNIQFGTTDDSACTVLRGLLETVSVPYEGPQTLLPLLQATEAAKTKADWDVLIIMWAFRPSDYFPVKISKFRAFALHLGVPLVGKQRLSTEHYPPLRDFVLGFGPFMQDWQPRNPTDIQSVVWDMAHHELGEEQGSDEGSQEESEEPPNLREEPPSYQVAPNYRIWVIAAGPQAQHWNEWQSGNYVALGWDIGDASVLTTKPAIREAMLANDLDGGMNDVNAVYQFTHEMRVGDMVFVKQGRSRLMGWGVISSPYRFEPEVHYPHRRSVNWMSKELRDVAANSMPTKTLTLIPSHKPQHQMIRQAYHLDAASAAVPATILKASRRYTREDALRDLFMPHEEVNKILTQIRRRKNLVLQGPPGVGKTFIAKRLAYLMMEEKAPERVKMVQFHQSYSYEDFIQGFRPCEDGSFKLHYGHFYDFCKRAEADEDNDYFFIIDEINRGNMSKIFGELLMLLEHDKRGPDYAVGLAYSSGDADEPEEFSVPENVHVIGTMNTADKSLALVDFAMRRRFAFVNLRPQFGAAYQQWMTGECEAAAEFVTKLVSRVTALNEDISKDRQLGAGCCIGHSFFTPDRDDPPTDWKTWLDDVVRCEIEPLLLEYWPDDPSRAELAVEALLS